MAETSDDDLIEIDNCADTWSLKMATASDFQRLHNAISNNVTKFNNKTTDLENLVKKLGTEEDSEQLRERYLQLQNEAKSLMQQINTDLKQLKDISLGNDTDRKKKQNLIEAVTKQYMPTTTRFQEAQRTGARKEKESLARARGAAYYQNNAYDSQYTDNSPSSNGAYQQQVTLPMEQNVDMKALRERDDQLRELEKNIVQVSELFTDVARIVQDHGVIIDSIEDNTRQTEVHVVTATQKLGHAVVLQTAARRKKILLCCILITVIVVIAMILGLYFGLKK